jgi:DNA-binding NarL/FixJ family response regulator
LIQILSETSDLTVIAEVDNGNDLIDKIREIQVDIVLLDVCMPGKSGWEVLIQLRAEHPELPVIILSISPEVDYAVKFFRAGASAYLHKTSAPAQLVDAIRKVARGGKYVSPAIAEKLAYDVDSSAEKQPHDKLSPREFQILCLIASGKTVKEIAAELSLSVPTISTYRTRILEKMEMKTNAQLTHYAFKNNLVD